MEDFYQRGIRQEQGPPIPSFSPAAAAWTYSAKAATPCKQVPLLPSSSLYAGRTGEPEERVCSIQGTFLPHGPARGGCEALLHFGGFPEPFINRAIACCAVHNEKLDRLFREDIRDIAVIMIWEAMQALSDLLPGRVGSLLSTNAIREDLEVSFKAVAHWLDLLESFYYDFAFIRLCRIWSSRTRKNPRCTCWDWSEIANEAVRFENMVASHLLKLVHYLHDFEGYKAAFSFCATFPSVRWIFLVAVDNRPWLP